MIKSLIYQYGFILLVLIESFKLVRMKKGWVYVLINPSMQGLFKVGYTYRDAEERAIELSANTGVPTPFVVVFKYECTNPIQVEKLVHDFLSAKSKRISDKREFFEGDPSIAIEQIIRLSSEMTDSETNEIEEPLRPAWFEFEQKGIAYMQGKGQIKDENKGKFLLEKADKLGSPSALLLSVVLQPNWYEKKSNKTILLELRDKGNSDACYYLAYYEYSQLEYLSNAFKLLYEYFEGSDESENEIRFQALLLLLELLILHFPEDEEEMMDGTIEEFEEAAILILVENLDSLVYACKSHLKKLKSDFKKTNKGREYIRYSALIFDAGQILESDELKQLTLGFGFEKIYQMGYDYLEVAHRNSMLDRDQMLDGLNSVTKSRKLDSFDGLLALGVTLLLLLLVYLFVTSEF